jgi:hypothetical protein
MMVDRVKRENQWVWWKIRVLGRVGGFMENKRLTIDRYNGFFVLLLQSYTPT